MTDSGTVYILEMPLDVDFSESFLESLPKSVFPFIKSCNCPAQSLISILDVPFVFVLLTKGSVFHFYLFSVVLSSNNK